MKRRLRRVALLCLCWWVPHSWCFLPSRRPYSLRVSPVSIRLSTEDELECKSSELLKRNNIGTWEADKFQDVLDVMEAWSMRSTRRTCLMLERLLRRVVEEKLARNPNAAGLDMKKMYTAVIQCWAKSYEKGSARRTEEILDNMQSAYEEGDTSLKPDIKVWNDVLLAYASSKHKDSPLQAIRVLQKLHDLISEGKTDVIPNKESYAAILRAYASIGGVDAPLLVKKLLERMEQLSQAGFPSVKPDFRSHNVFLGAIASSISRENAPSSELAREAESYLQKMMASTDEDERPNTWSFNMVISAWSKSGDWEMAVRAEALLSQLESYHAESGYSEKTMPNTNTYNCVIACYSRSKLWDKARRSHAILERMKKMEAEGKLSRRPDAVTYNTVMNSYAKSREADAPMKVEAILREMHEIYEKSGDRFQKPSSRSFNTCVSFE